MPKLGICQYTDIRTLLLYTGYTTGRTAVYPDIISLKNKVWMYLHVTGIHRHVFL